MSPFKIRYEVWCRNNSELEEFWSKSMDYDNLKDAKKHLSDLNYLRPKHSLYSYHIVKIEYSLYEESNTFNAIGADLGIFS
jgi:hypothetical protein